MNKVVLIAVSTIMLTLCFTSSSAFRSNIGKFVIMLDLVQYDNGENPTTNVGFFLSGVGAGRYECITMTGVAEELSDEKYRSHGVPKKADAA
ncbi:MAG: hypothetical protein ACKO5I_07280 [Ignavibacteria bacterium]